MENELLIWVRSWEDTFTAAGRTIEECHEFLRPRLEAMVHAYIYDAGRISENTDDLRKAFD